tara:strand:- start:108 stop:854 length:747 start_codon:yes stop_codon:yes gene_type:complete
MWLKITNNYSPNFSLPKRKKTRIKHIIIHYTGMKSENAAINRLCDERKNVSAHYFIKNNGCVINIVPDLYEAWHAGKSRWDNHNSLNKTSIGIEIQNPGHNSGYKKYSSKQINSLKLLLKKLIKKYRINIKNILGHSDIAPERKKDPGEKFPWKKLAKINLSIWHNLSEINLKKDRLKKLCKSEENKFMDNLYKFGYKKLKNFNKKLNNKIIIKAFQRRFRQTLINGIPDVECYLISKNLLKSGLNSY